MADATLQPPLNLHHLLGRPLAITTKDGRLLIGIFHCTDRQMNIILLDTQEFPPPPVNKEEIKRRDWEEIWLPRSQRLDGEPDWLPWANLPSSIPDLLQNDTKAQTSTSTDGPEAEQGEDWGLNESAPSGAAEEGGEQGKGEHHTTDDFGVETRHLERAGSDEDPAGHGEDLAGELDLGDVTGSLAGWKWGYGRGPGRYTGMAMIPGHQVVKIEVVHGARADHL